ncbi:MAG: hypothetical protein HJJLKODD_00318 [Phycisphaerae bacterium]|nr:hypothetical protein [Phycisphaerae bacterium]
MRFAIDRRHQKIIALLSMGFLFQAASCVPTENSLAAFFQDYALQGLAAYLL